MDVDLESNAVFVPWILELLHFFLISEDIILLLIDFGALGEHLQILN
jgi:hypothetical protein